MRCDVIATGIINGHEIGISKPIVVRLQCEGSQDFD
jgi:succinyl-CoA synthetase beta subunit